MNIGKIKPTRYKKVKGKAWKILSDYVRMRDFIIYRRCVSCGKTINDWKDGDAGHFISMGGHGALTGFNDDNVHLQCLTKDSKIELSGGSKITLDKVKQGDLVLAFDEKDFSEKKTARVISTASFMPDKLYLVELEDGTKFKATKDHRVVLSTHGENRWERIDNIYNMLHNNTECNIITS